MSGDRRTSPLASSVSDDGLLAETRFVPQRYEPNYAYPLLVFFHARGGDEHQLVRSMPAMSWRNYVGLGLRGPEAVARRDHPEAASWGSTFARPDRQADCSARLPDREIVRRTLWPEPSEPRDPVDWVEDGVFNAVRRARRQLHVHSERIFLVGYGEGAAVAYHLGLNYPERFAGVVAINGWLPSGSRPLGRLKACRGLRILAVHGEWNTKAPIETARRQVATLRAGGLRVAFQTYPSAHRLTRACSQTSITG